MIDGTRSEQDAAKTSNKPVVASHTSCWGIREHCRAKTDEVMKATFDTGGYCETCCVPSFLGGKGVITDLLDHIDYIVGRIGVDHVGIGSDFDGYSGVTRGLEDVSRLPALTAGLVARGYDQTSVRKILGLNLLRVFRQVAG